MPEAAIKRCIRNPDTNKIDILDECFPSEAFKFLGLSSKYDNAKIHVEDELARRLVISVIQNNSDRFDNFHVFFAPGGASYMKQNYILHYSQENNNKNFVLFDGDQHYAWPILDLDSLPAKDLNNKDYLKQEIKNFTRQDIDFAKDGGNGKSRDDQIIEAQQKYITFYKRCVRFLPKETPEEIIWDDSLVGKLLQESVYLIDVLNEPNYKLKISKTALAFIGNSDPGSIRAIQDILIKNWIEKDDDCQLEIKKFYWSLWGL
ncbi:hypothetical protein ASL14_20520 [Paenibacillus sp. IHB B 3084]|uniref:hypothetical protein n=1 Tax=Paenibacillus sp. IHB B 3084 TaxID=867076 RepID=UPI0007216F5B|nr:hypothetical protein [Paenibacillus sp. IHB B 3084]ALP38199.1 hypothetical protein ASL14_20520 [Paenibacillus sp. IHB B 3084]